MIASCIVRLHKRALQFTPHSRLRSTIHTHAPALIVSYYCFNSSAHLLTLFIFLSRINLVVFTIPVQRQQTITSLFQQSTPESETTNPKTKSKKPNPTSEKTDIIISIKIPHMDNIVSRVKNHEFRKYNISSNIERMWYVILAFSCIWLMLNWLQVLCISSRSNTALHCCD